MNKSLSKISSPTRKYIVIAFFLTKLFLIFHTRCVTCQNKYFLPLIKIHIIYPRKSTRSIVNWSLELCFSFYGAMKVRIENELCSEFCQIYTTQTCGKVSTLELYNNNNAFIYLNWLISSIHCLVIELVFPLLKINNIFLLVFSSLSWFMIV